MKRFHSILAGLLLAALSTPAGAITFQVTADTVGLTAKNTIAKSGGTASSLAISSKSTAFLSFGVGGSGIPADSVTGARLILYFAKVTKPGSLTLALNTSAFQETFATPSIPFPTSTGLSGGTIAVTAANNKGYLVIPGFQAIVQSWLTNPASDFGLSITGDATLNATLTSKEGSIGVSAMLEIDVNPSGGGINADTLTTTGVVTGGSFNTTGAITGGAISATTVTASGAIAGGSLSTGGALSAGAISAASLAATGAVSANDLSVTTDIGAGGNVNATGAITGASLSTGGTLSAGTVSAGSLAATGAINGGSLSTGGTLSAGTVSAGSVAATGAITGGSLSTTGALNAGTVSATTGTFTGNLFTNVISGTGGITTAAQMRAATVGVGIAGANTRGKLEVSGTVNRATSSLLRAFFAADHATVLVSTPGGGTQLIAPLNPLSLTTVDAGGATSIFADSTIVSSTFLAISDERIKDVQGRSDSATDLAKLLSIEVTDYLYKDRVYRGSRPQKKVIAQQVEKIFPQAVNRSTDVVPDIYQKAVITDGWVDLATDLMVGDRVRLIGEKDDEDSIHEVLEVSESGFRTAFQPAGTQVFVYGREVKDFRTVDYEAIAMLNVSATQELAKKLAAKDEELNRLSAANDALAQQLAALEKRDAARVALDARRTALDAELQARLIRLEATTSQHPAPAFTAALERE